MVQHCRVENSNVFAAENDNQINCSYVVNHLFVLANPRELSGGSLLSIRFISLKLLWIFEQMVG
jgi:hypothetical protein